MSDHGPGHSRRRGAVICKVKKPAKRLRENKDMGFVWAPHGISQALLASFAGWTKTQQRRHMSRHDFGCKGKSLYGAVADGPYGCNIDSYNLCGVSARRTGRDGVMKHGQQRMLTTSVCHVSDTVVGSRLAVYNKPPLPCIWRILPRVRMT